MLTAAEARKLAGLTAEEELKEIEGYITKAAQEKHRSVIIRATPYKEWLYNEKNMTDNAKEAIKKLREAGYSVRLYYVKKHFVDMGLEISW